MRKQLFLVVGLLVASSPALATTIDWVPVGNPNNPADTPAANCYAASCGSVDHTYYISKYEVTNAQYAEFLNAADAGGSNPRALYNPAMDSDPSNGGISLVGINAPGSKYVVKSGFASKPVTYVSFIDALRFSNWLNNGQGGSSTETGAYTLLGGTATPSNGNTVTRNGGAITFLTSENEWYKAAYYSPGGVYFDYPAGTDTQTGCAAPGATANTANCVSAVGVPTNVGAYTGSASPYGTFDQGGNVYEWNEQITIGSDRGFRGGSFAYYATSLGVSEEDSFGSGPTYENAAVGFRVASLVPEPGTGLLVMTGVVGIGARRRCRALCRHNFDRAA